MILDMKVPSPGESISEVEIASWLVSSGDYVEKDQAIAEVDSDKATLELPAEMSGVIEILVEPGTTVAVGQVVCKIDTSAEAPAGGAAKPASAAAPNPMPVAAAPAAQTYASGTPSPAAKKILDEKGIAPAHVSGTGKDGRITKEDAVNAKVSMGSTVAGRGETRQRMSALRRKLAQRLGLREERNGHVDHLQRGGYEAYHGFAQAVQGGFCGEARRRSGLHELLYAGGCSSAQTLPGGSEHD